MIEREEEGPASPLDDEADTAGWEHEAPTFLGMSISWAPSCAHYTWLVSLVSRSVHACFLLEYLNFTGQLVERWSTSHTIDPPYPKLWGSGARSCLTYLSAHRLSGMSSDVSCTHHSVPRVGLISGPPGVRPSQWGSSPMVSSTYACTSGVGARRGTVSPVPNADYLW